MLRTPVSGSLSALSRLAAHDCGGLLPSTLTRLPLPPPAQLSSRSAQRTSAPFAERLPARRTMFERLTAGVPSLAVQTSEFLAKLADVRTQLTVLSACIAECLMSRSEPGAQRFVRCPFSLWAGHERSAGLIA